MEPLARLPHQHSRLRVSSAVRAGREESVLLPRDLPQGGKHLQPPAEADRVPAGKLLRELHADGVLAEHRKVQGTLLIIRCLYHHKLHQLKHASIQHIIDCLVEVLSPGGQLRLRYAVDLHVSPHYLRHLP